MLRDKYGYIMQFRSHGLLSSHGRALYSRATIISSSDPCCAQTPPHVRSSRV